MSPTDVFVAKVDPQGAGLVYCGCVGGLSEDGCNNSQSLALDGNGCAYITGWTGSTEATFPVNKGPDLTYNGGCDVFIAKVAASGQNLEYCGYIGGSYYEWGSAVAVDKAGNAYVTGATFSTHVATTQQPIPFPVTVGPDLTYNGGKGDAFIAKVTPTGTALVYCGYIGGLYDDGCDAVALDDLGRAYVGGGTYSMQTSFPVQNGPDSTFNGDWGDAYVALVRASGTGLDYCGYIGGGQMERIFGIAVDASRNAYVTGSTSSDESSFPVKIGPDLTYNDGQMSPFRAGDTFVAKIANTDLTGGGRTGMGGTVTLQVAASNDAGFPYQVGSSLGIGPIPIDSRWLNLSPDDLLRVTVTDLWPWIFSGYRGVLDSRGRAQAAIHIPNLPPLIGTRIHSAFVTVDPVAPSGVRSISNTFSFSITK
jgi:hypothetical protein